MNLNSTFRKIASQFVTEFNDIAQEINHNLSAGEAREHALKELLRKYLPSRVGVDRGFVIDALGHESKQIDIVIYDKTIGTVFEVSGTKYFPCETVIAVGEVKSDINSIAKLDDALTKIKSAKALDRSNRGKNRMVTGPGMSITAFKFDPTIYHRDQIFGFIFTSASLTKDKLITCLQEFNANNDRQHWMNLFCDINHYIISYQCNSYLVSSAMEAQSLYCTEQDSVPDLLLTFYCILATFVDQAHVATPEYFDYGSINETIATYYGLVKDNASNNFPSQLPAH